MDQVKAVVFFLGDRVVHQAQITETFAFREWLEIAELLDGIVGEDEGFQIGNEFVKRLDAVDPVVRQQEVLQPRHPGEVAQYTQIVVCKVNRVVQVLME